MRLSDAGLHRLQTKALYLNHRLPPSLTEDSTRDRSNRLLDGCVDLYKIVPRSQSVRRTPNSYDQKYAAQGKHSDNNGPERNRGVVPIRRKGTPNFAGVNSFQCQ
jgi:hypothetical protein